MNDYLIDLVFNLEKNEEVILSLLKNQRIINEAKEIINYLKIKENINPNNIYENMTLEKYISLTDVDEEIKIYTDDIKNDKIKYN